MYRQQYLLLVLQCLGVELAHQTEEFGPGSSFGIALRYLRKRLPIALLIGFMVAGSMKLTDIMIDRLF